MTIFIKNCKNHKWDEFVKIQEFTLVIFPKNINLGLQMKVLKFLGIQPRIKSSISNSKKSKIKFFENS